MDVLIERVSVPESGILDLQVPSIQINISAEQARRIVNRWLLNEVSYMMHAHIPTLVINGHTRWRVPAVLTATHVGTVGVVGAVDVDATTGEMFDLEAQKEHVLTNAAMLATPSGVWPWGPYR